MDAARRHIDTGRELRFLEGGWPGLGTSSDLHSVPTPCPPAYVVSRPLCRVASADPKLKFGDKG